MESRPLIKLCLGRITTRNFQPLYFQESRSMRLCCLPLIGVCLLTALLGAGELVKPRKGDVSAGGQYVPVSIDGFAAHQANAGLGSSAIVVGGVPFNLIRSAG